MNSVQHALRTRWAAIGAAVAVTLGAGGFGIARATTPSGASTLVAITPCRLLDTRRAPDNVGNRATPIAANQTHRVSAHGSNGECVGVPTSATALSLNVTAVGATTRTFLTIWAAGKERPLASSLNPSPGEPPTPNSVVAELSSSGQFEIYNFAGSVDVVVDVNGYYSDHTHDQYAGRTVTDTYGPFELSWETSTFMAVGCIAKPPNSTTAAILSFNVPVGARLDRVRVNARDHPAASSLFAVLYRREVTVTGATVRELDNAGGGSSSNERVILDLVPEAADRTVSPGDSHEMWFFGGAVDQGAVCGVEVTYTLPIP